MSGSSTTVDVVHFDAVNRWIPNSGGDGAWEYKRRGCEDIGSGGMCEETSPQIHNE
jgi:hypothetical protein